MNTPSVGVAEKSGIGEKRVINSELWHACAGPLVALPPVGTLVVYFPQGHSEQVAASMQKETNGIPSYPNLPPKMMCMLHNLTLHADPDTDEVYAQMTLQPVNKYDQEALLVSDVGLRQSRQPAEFFCKTLTASDTSTHGGFSVPRRAAEKIFPPLDFSMQPPTQELTARDLHDQTWTFRHIYRGQPKRHLLTSGWSVFVSCKRVVAGDAVLFIRDEKSQFLLGIRRAHRQQPPLSSSVISSDSMHIGILAAAAHAAASNSPFTVFFNPRASTSEFVVPLSKYTKAMYHRVSPGMRFRMSFETEESGVRRYMGTVTAVSDLDPVSWKNSQWRNLQVGWDESTAGERPSRVSIWDIEPVVSPFYMFTPPVFFPKLPVFTDDDADMENIYKRGMPWLADDFRVKDASSSIFPGLSLVQWMSMQQNHSMLANQSGLHPGSTSIQGNIRPDYHQSKILNPTTQALDSSSLHLSHQISQLQQSTASWPQQKQLQGMLQSPGKTQLTLDQQLQLQQQQPQLFQHQLQQSTQLQPLSTCDQTTNQNLQQTTMYSQLQQNNALTEKVQELQNEPFAKQASFPTTPLTLDLTSKQHIDQQSIIFQRPQSQQMHLQQDPLQVLQHNLYQRSPQQNFSDQQMKILQKLQQHQQLLSPQNSLLDNQFSPRQQMHQNQCQWRLSAPLQVNVPCFSESTAGQLSQIPANHFQSQELSPLMVRSTSAGFSDYAPSSSVTPTKNNIQVSHPNFIHRNQIGHTPLQNNATVTHSTNLLQETRDSKIGVQMKHEIPNSVGSDHLKYMSTDADHLISASSATSFCLDASVSQHSFPVNGLDSDFQSHRQSRLSLGPDALLSKGFGAGKDIENMLSNSSGTPADLVPNLPNIIDSLPFGESTVSFKTGCSDEIAVNDSSLLTSGLWLNQAPRMRTYAKVQKRGSVGRTIDVTRYMGYDELKRDLAQMFGIEGLLEDPRQTDWKLVYVDHENDILLVGDDPWEEFVTCVKSIKILSSAEMQQMSLDVDLSRLPTQNQACSTADSGNVWREE